VTRLRAAGGQGSQDLGTNACLRQDRSGSSKGYLRTFALELKEQLAQALTAYVTSILVGRLDAKEAAEPPLRKIIGVLQQVMCTHDVEKLAISVLEIYQDRDRALRSQFEYRLDCATRSFALVPRKALLKISSLTSNKRLMILSHQREHPRHQFPEPLIRHVVLNRVNQSSPIHELLIRSPHLSKTARRHHTRFQAVDAPGHV